MCHYLFLVLQQVVQKISSLLMCTRFSLYTHTHKSVTPSFVFSRCTPYLCLYARTRVLPSLSCSFFARVLSLSTHTDESLSLSCSLSLRTHMYCDVLKKLQQQVSSLQILHFLCFYTDILLSLSLYAHIYILRNSPTQSVVSSPQIV